MTRKRQGGPAPMNHLEHHRDAGPASLFPLAREAILTWHLQEGAGVIARPRRRVRAGMIVNLRLNPVWPTSPRRLRGHDLNVRVGSCEVLEVIDEPRAAGFVYRTLPGHLESGEQTFLVSIGADDRLGDLSASDDRLIVSIVSDSVPGHPLLRAFAPFSVAAQRMMARRYVEGLRRMLDRRQDDVRA
ncbi:DUF1990 family protein [Brevibacterium sp. GP-SGM9]|uniref:DUF1990 family protein n=1 Tax=Brevibacterium sp. GP-SGM9 TaxID=3376990 RepID=UPI0039A7295C